jgi:hypothetical protein
MFWLFAEFDWLMYETLLPALPHHAELPALACDTVAELDCELVMLWLKLKLHPPQTASSSLSVNSRIVLLLQDCNLLHKRMFTAWRRRLLGNTTRQP